jgi:pimeloyl-ACP methyl ester carboxylesterase
MEAMAVVTPASLVASFPFSAPFGRFAPPVPLRTFLRATVNRLRPPRPVTHRATIRHRQEALLANGAASPRQQATLLCEPRRGAVPTIVLGGFVPDATEAIFLLRGLLLKSGSLYCFNYPRGGFSTDLLFAQLDDLVEELNLLQGQPPVIFAVSFGAGLLVEWLRRAQTEGRRPALRGLVMISPVACVEDLLSPGEAKPGTLLGRAIKPYVEPGATIDGKVVEKSRTIFQKMFEAGAQNKEVLGAILSRNELRYLRTAVLTSIQAIDCRGAWERVQSLRHLRALSVERDADVQPLAEAPTLILYAEKESSVLVERSPTRFAFNDPARTWFPQGECRLVSNQRGNPVQHASLIFHCSDFHPHLAGFYRQLKSGHVPCAA